MIGAVFGVGTAAARRRHEALGDQVADLTLGGACESCKLANIHRSSFRHDLCRKELYVKSFYITFVKMAIWAGFVDRGRVEAGALAQQVGRPAFATRRASSSGGLRVDVALPDDLRPAHGLGEIWPAGTGPVGSGPRWVNSSPPNKLSKSMRPKPADHIVQGHRGWGEASNRSIAEWRFAPPGCVPRPMAGSHGRRKRLHCVIVIRPGWGAPMRRRDFITLIGGAARGRWRRAHNGRERRASSGSSARIRRACRSSGPPPSSSGCGNWGGPRGAM